ncbi:MAG: hypothetical protein OXU34_04800 [Gammaproteobacteria bacterium]|nr:hypothetical protein [Gammaproteobacteria bacterium]
MKIATPESIGKVYHQLTNDPEFLARVETDARGAFAEKGVELPDSMKVVVRRNTKDTLYMPVPADPSAANTIAVSDESLSSVAGGSTTSSAGSGGTASTVWCFPATFSSASTASTAGTAASAET